MKKKLSLDKELVTSTEQIVVDLDGASAPPSIVHPSCQITQCVSCWPTDCSCSVYE